MINYSQSMPCPVCAISINFDTQQLLQGVKFACTNCNANIGLTQDAKQSVSDTIEKFVELKKKS